MDILCPLLARVDPALAGKPCRGPTRSHIAPVPPSAPELPPDLVDLPPESPVPGHPVDDPQDDESREIEEPEENPARRAVRP